MARLEQLSYWPQLEARLRQLVDDGLPAPVIAQRLNQDGLRPPKRCKRFSAGGVRRLIQRLGLRRRWSRTHDRAGSLDADEWWLRDLADELGMPTVTMYSWLRRGWTTGRQIDDGRWAIWADAGELERLRELRERPRGYYTRRRWTETESATDTSTIR